MILNVLLCCLVFGVTQGQDVIRPSPLEVPRLLETSLVCIGKTGADADILYQFITWKVKETKIAKDFLWCFARKAGYCDKDGRIVKDAALKVVGNHPKRNEIADVIDNCNELDGADKYERLFRIASCFHEKTPVKFDL